MLTWALTIKIRERIYRLWNSSGWMRAYEYDMSEREINRMNANMVIRVSEQLKISLIGDGYVNGKRNKNSRD